MNNYSVKDFMKTVFNPFEKSIKKNNKYKNYILIVRILITIKVFLILSIFLQSQVLFIALFFTFYNITNPFELIWFLLQDFDMKLNDIYKKIAILEKKVEFLESKLKLKNSSNSREDKWNEFQSIIRLQEKNNSRKVLN